MLEAADVFIQNALCKKCKPPAATYDYTRGNAVIAFDYSKMAVRLIDWLALAEKLHLAKTLVICEAWLINHLHKYQEEYAKLFVLGQDNVIRIMRGVAEKLNN